MLNSNASYKNQTTYRGQFLIKQLWTNGMATLQYGAKTNRYNICRIKQYKYYADIEDITTEEYL